MYKTAIEILTTLNNMGYEAYIVGGFARDLYLKIPSNDIDICTSAKPDIIKGLFCVIKDNAKFGSIIIKKNNFNYEITTFRKDTYINSRYPKIDFVNTLKEDLNRRDFIINTLCIDNNGNFIDLLGAKKDLDNKIINCVEDVNIKFNEDPLRILRCIRFACKFDFSLSNDIHKAIKKYNYKLKNLSKIKIRNEISKILKLENGAYYLKKFNLEEYIQ